MVSLLKYHKFSKANSKININYYSKMSCEETYFPMSEKTSIPEEEWEAAQNTKA